MAARAETPETLIKRKKDTPVWFRVVYAVGGVAGLVTILSLIGAITDSVPAPVVANQNPPVTILYTTETPTETPARRPSLIPSPSSTPEPSKTTEPKTPTKLATKRVTATSTAANTPANQSDEFFNDEIVQITLRSGELKTFKYLQTADHSRFCLKGANLQEIQVGIYNPETPVQFSPSKNRFVNSIANGNVDKVVYKDQGCDQFAATGAGNYFMKYWPVAFHNSLDKVKSFFFTIGERSLGCLGAGEKLRVIEDLGSGLITWIGKKCG